MNWIPVEQEMPASGRIVLATYLNAHGKRRIIRAEWIAANTAEVDGDADEIGEYCEEDDAFYWPEGWYEVIDNWEDYSAIAVHEGKITHWMPLPECP